jgi:molecular chaperone GrpE
MPGEAHYFGGWRVSKHEETTTPVDDVHDSSSDNGSDAEDIRETANDQNTAEAAAENMPPDSIPESNTNTSNASGAGAQGPSVAEQILSGSDLKSQNEEYLLLVQRTRAEFANYKKRTEREMSEARQRGALDAVTSMLPIVDDFERAMENVPADLQGNSWVNGVTLLLKQFDKVLSEYGVEVINPTGETFDPNRHEAIGMEDSDTVASGHVTVTLRKGYSSGDRVLRPALVKVAN